MKEAIYGLKPVLEALKARRRKFYRIYFSRVTKGFLENELLKEAQKQNIPVLDAERKTLSRIAGTSEHQGVVAVTSSYPVLSRKDIQKDLPFLKTLVLLDGIQDPRNLGAVARSAVAFNVSALVIPSKNSASPTPAAVKTSAGLLERLRVYRVTSLNHTVKLLVNARFTICAASAEKGEDPGDLCISPPWALVVGSEARGISSSLLKRATVLVKVPISEEVDSLNVAVACGIILYAMKRNERVKG